MQSKGGNKNRQFLDVPFTSDTHNIGGLTKLEGDVLQFLFNDTWFRRYFYLTGGTALSAFYLHHRISDDLDFFSTIEIDLTPIPMLIKQAGKTLKMKIESIQTSPGFLRYNIGGTLKLDIVSDAGFRVGAPLLIGNFMVDNLNNIAVNKVCAILGRLDVKDYVDLYFLVQQEKLNIFELLELGTKKDAGLDPFIWASLIAEAENFTILPKMIKPIELKDLKGFFLKLRDKILDKIKPKGRDS